MQSIFDVWNCRNLTIFGRCLIAKSLGIAQLVHMISNLNISKAYIQAVNSAIFKFIWKNKKDRLAQLVEHRTAVREVAGSNLGRTNTQGL